MPGQSSQSALVVQVTNPDQTFNRIYFLGSAGTSSGWRVGLPYLVDTYDVGGTVPQRQATTTWTQDDESKSYIVNPRILETNVYDPSGNRKRTEIQYQSYALGNGMSCQLPQDVREYAGDASTVLRTTRTIYIDDSPYLSRRIIGLPKESLLYEGVVGASNLRSKREFKYDEAGSIAGNDAPVQHDPAYSSSFVSGRGNLTMAKRYNVDNLSQFSSSTVKYNTAGAVVSSKDALLHETKISYADSFSDGIARTTLAYPTKLTDAVGYYSTSKYNFDFGAMTYQQAPPPNYTGPASQQPAGPEQSFEYYDHGRLKKQINLVNSAYTRFVYESNGTRLSTFATIQDGLGEAQSFAITDGAGRVIASAKEHSLNTFSAQKSVYDVMGRVIKTSNPTETEASGAPSQWNTTGTDAGTGWTYTEHTYDWKGRPLVTTSPSMTSNPGETTTKQISYAGCGCAGGEVATLKDEGTIDSGVAKRRKQKLYSDVLGRVVKTELFNWDTESIYSTTVHTYNVRDQITQTRQYEGAEGSSVFQDTITNYDGYGRPQGMHAPHHSTGTSTIWAYNADDTISEVTDARGVVKAFAYNSRKLLTAVNHSVPNNSGIPVPGEISFTYDALGNRLSMTDDTGDINYQYNNLSQLASETREFSGPLVGNEFTLTYEYRIGGRLKKITDHTNTTINYDYNRSGQLDAVTGENNLVEGVSNYASGFEYRAWGAVSNIDFGNGTTQQVSFNSRLLPTSSSSGNFDLGTNPHATMSWNYEYYADARPRYSADATDNRFDRKLDFDHAGRLKEAYSGREARGLTATSPADSPYRQSFQYNALRGRSQKSGRFWRTDQIGATPCAPRQANDGCDSEGNVLTHNGNNHIYDGLGMQVSFVSWRNPVGGAPNHLEFLPASEIAQSYDGNGQPAKRIETRRSEELINGGPNINITQTLTTTYHIYSSVMGGAPVVELDASGNKNKGYVYANDTRLAKQEIGSISSAVTWYHLNPGTNSWIETGTERMAVREEMDPDGAEVGTADPWSSVILESPPTYEKFKEEEPLYLEGGNPFDYSEGLTIDGLPVTRAEFDRRTGNSSAGAQVSRGGRPLVFVSNQHQLSYVTLDVFDVDDELRNEPQSRRWGGTYFRGTIDLNLLAQTQWRSSSKRVPLQTADELREEFKKLLANEKCKTFVDKLIVGAEGNVDATLRLNLGFEDLFENISGQGGYVQVDGLKIGNQVVTGLVDRNKTSIVQGNAQAEIATRGYFIQRAPNDISPARAYALQRRHYVAAAFHETFHHIGKVYSAYSDQSLGTAAFAITGDTTGLPTNNDPLAWSSYWDNQLMKHCMPDLVRAGNIVPPSP